MKMKRSLLLCLLAALILLLCACSQQPPEGLKKETPQDAPAIYAEPDDGTALQFTATLYFAYGDTGLLRQESRVISRPPNETREKAMVRALLEGSREAGSRALFPEKTEVLSTHAQDGILYITFNEALYDRYADEDAARESAILRRRLALDALTATLTESGEYGSVQVLVRAEANVGRSMRLTSRFFWEEPEVTVPPLTRQSSRLPAPSAYARELLLAWQDRSAERLSAFVSARDNRSGALAEDLAAARALLSYAVYDGTVSPDGGSAVVCVDLTLRDADGVEFAVDAYPLRLVSEGGAWKILRSQLTGIMGDHNE